VTRTWGNVLDAIIALKKGDTKYRWETVAKDRALAPIKKLVVTNTPGQSFLDAMQAGTVSTNVYLRRMHNFALDMNWLLNPVIAKRVWPKVVYGDKRAIKLHEHLAILAAEFNLERRAFYEMCWHLGASQGDSRTASLQLIHVELCKMFCFAA
jgi:hypothetical protein